MTPKSVVRQIGVSAQGVYTQENGTPSGATPSLARSASSSSMTTSHRACPINEIGDIEAVKRAFPDTVTIQELHAKYASLSFNELQLRLYSGCQRFVSVLGGGAYLASYFGGTNIILARQGWEVDCGAYDRWFDRFSGARVIAVGSGRELIEAVEREFFGGG